MKILISFLFSFLFCFQSFGAGLFYQWPGDVNVGSKSASSSLRLLNQGELRFLEANAGGVNYTGFKAPAALAGNVIYTMPAADGSAGQLLKTDGAKNLAWDYVGDAIMVRNVGITTSVGSNALTVAIKDQAGNDPSATSPVIANFRSSTATTGTYTTIALTSALSLVVSTGSTLGHPSASQYPIYVYLINSTGTTIKLGLSTALLDDKSLQTTVAEGGAGGALYGSLLYSDAAYTNVPVRLIGRLLSTQSTAGQWASAMQEVSIGRFEKDSNPIGTILPFGAAVIPPGYLLANGGQISRTIYSKLFAVIGTSFGYGDNSTTFNRPNGQGKFLRGTDNAAAIDPDRAARVVCATGGATGDNVGSCQGDVFQGHYHTISGLTLISSTGHYNADTGTTYLTGRTDLYSSVTGPITDGSNGTPRTSSESRPVNIGVNFIIRAY
jgi:microcystin-dependent protein